MLLIFTSPVLNRHLWQLEIVVFLHWCLICAVLLVQMFSQKFKSDQPVFPVVDVLGPMFKKFYRRNFQLKAKVIVPDKLFQPSLCLEPTRLKSLSEKVL